MNIMCIYFYIFLKNDINTIYIDILWKKLLLFVGQSAVEKMY